jgi:hypothetical protein
MNYAGTVIANLYAHADNLVALAVKRNAAICHICRQTRGEHSHGSEHCPSRYSVGRLYMETRFVALTCTATESRGSWDPGQECGHSVVEGTELCPRHLAEMEEITGGR